MTTEQLSPELKQKISDIVSKNKVVLFMKGNKNFPQCGFSDAVVTTPTFYGVHITDYDVLPNPHRRSGVKISPARATSPQHYINGEFVGGCDIVMDMHQNGELKPLLE